VKANPNRNIPMKYIGIEIDKNYHAIATRRLNRLPAAAA
jgi:hypothetical protein